MSKEIVISNAVKNFVKEYFELINTPSQHKELVRIANETLHSNNDLAILFFMLREIGINLDDYRWELFDNDFLSAIAHMKRRPYADDKSASWSRLDYMLEEVDYQGFTHSEIVNHLKEPEVANKLDIKLRPLAAEYGWMGAGDYDLGWFKEDIFRKEFPEEFI